MKTTQEKKIKSSNTQIFHSKRASVELIQRFPVLTPMASNWMKTWN